MDIELDDLDPFEEYLAMASYAILHAIRSAFHKKHKHSPVQLVLGRNMSMPINIIIDWKQSRNTNKKQFKRAMKEKI